jgi:hypothetical protein
MGSIMGKWIRAFALLLVMPGCALAQQATLTDIIVTNTRDDLLLFMNVEGAFHESIESAVFSGVPVTFSFFVTLHQGRDFWIDKEIADLKFTHTIKYDNLKKEFTVYRSWQKGEPLVTKSIDYAKKHMTEINSFRVAPLSQLEKGKTYQLRAKAELSKRTLPLYLHYVFFFMSLWDFETDWYTIDFVF